MRHHAEYLTLLLALVVSACAGGCGGSGHPKITDLQKITELQIEKDIVGKETDEPHHWAFAQDAPKEIKLLDGDCIGDKATIVIDMKTRGTNPWIGRARPLGDKFPDKMSGKLRLHYEWVAKEWVLVRVENLTFKME